MTSSTDLSQTKFRPLRAPAAIKSFVKKTKQEAPPKSSNAIGKNDAQATMDELKRLDKERFKQGDTGSLQVAHYKSLSTDGKRELSKQLKTNKDTYMAYMHAFESKQK